MEASLILTDSFAKVNVNLLTTLLAVWGAVVSTVALGWHIVRDLRDRGKLRVFCYIGEIVGGFGPSDSTPKLVYNVTNVGRRPSIVTHIGGKYADDRHFMVLTQVPLPRTLQPGEYFVEVSKVSVLDENPTALWAIDSLGKHWKIPRRQLKYLLNRHQDRAEEKPEVKANG